MVQARTDDTRSRTAPPDYVARADALRILEVKPQTLYSYVSRGLIRRLAGPQGRGSYYHRDDLQRLKARSVARSGHGPAAASAVHWGEPVLTTSITEITPEGPRYRDRLATELARGGMLFETVAEYLWSGRLGAVTEWSNERQLDVIVARLAGIVRLHPQAHIHQILTELVLLVEMANRAQEGDDELTRARALIRAMTGALGFLGPGRRFVTLAPDESIHQGMARALGIAASEANLDALNMVAILFADHELTPATFSARIAASAGSDLYACIGAALHVHFGSALGLRCDRVDQLIAGELFDGDARGIDAILESAHTPYGLVHPLYRNGDPRVQMIVDLALHVWSRKADAGAPPVSASEAWRQLTLEEALVVLCRALGTSQQAAGGLLAVARTAGWVAHITEQHRAGFMIRPRGKFVRQTEPVGP
jgi:citrate synthase